MDDGQQRYDSDCRTGLTDAQVKSRIDEGLTNAYNTNTTKSYKQIFKDNLVTFFNILNMVFTVLIVMTGYIKELVFLLVVVGNLVIGIAQEIVTKKTLDKLSVIVAAKVTVVRNGAEKEIGVSDIVLDDVMQLNPGNQVCADGVLLEGTVEVNESLITGESDVVAKGPGDFLYSGSFIVSGNAYARVERVGIENYANKISYDAKVSKKRTSELRNSLNRILKIISIIIVPVGVLLFLKQGLVVGLPVPDNTVKTVGALIGMIPEGLILLTSISLATSAVILATKRTLVQDLYCIETLARVDILCLDKTGTITEGKMHVEEVIPVDSTKDLDRILSNMAGALQDDNATFHAVVEKFGKSYDHEVKTIVPFSSARKYSGVSFEGQGTYFLGAFEFIFPNGYEGLDAEKYAKKGSRVLVLAHSDATDVLDNKVPGGMRPIAFLLISDRIRADAKKTLEFFENQQVEVKIISGDSAVTASAIAKRAGVKNYEAVDATMLKTKEDIEAAAEKYNVFGRVTPSQKKELIAAMKRKGHTVAMAGDGVNDVLALKESDCSIAMASGSDAAKNIANLVLLDSNFATMPDIVNEGRKVINNIERVATLFITKTVYAVLLAFATVILLDSSYPFTPLQMTLISFVTIGFPAFFLALEPNFAPIKEHFLINILKKSLPGGLSVIIGILAVNVLAGVFQYTPSAVSTMCMLMAVAVGMWVVAKVSMPFTTARKIILGSAIGLFFLCLIFLRGFFDVAPINLPQAVVVCVFTAVAPFMMRGFERIVEKRADKFLSKKLVRRSLHITDDELNAK
ncbi:cation-translocating P-type ATPase [Christensenella tenuis]|jgi:cation-transporting P-type ATPase E|uniref:Cation-translocating P-type ATPase n=1 Tax=Christensenella tenuis TaxID=2763033 RepID=A0ABR7EFX0_9FIRM|nr:cation-translocating P-type ATPase [Christensenella tenuis]MBC5648650.1 cation-translocating P-type ATPase [Christensenella tenuis]